jgi:hypothetical protein
MKLISTLSIEKQHGQHELVTIDNKGFIFPASSTLWLLQFNERSLDARPASTWNSESNQ